MFWAEEWHDLIFTSKGWLQLLGGELIAGEKGFESREISWGSCYNKKKDVSGSEKGGSTEGAEKSLDSEYILRSHWILGIFWK